MTTEEFWKHYIGCEKLTDIFDIICEFFSKDLPDDFIEEYDVDEVILETLGKNEDAKKFQNILKFTELLQTKHPALYKENFKYFDTFLVDYYCHQQDAKEIEKALANFMVEPDADFDYFLIVLRKILFYQHLQILDKVIVNGYKQVNESNKLMDYAAIDFAVWKFYLNLEERYSQSLATNIFPREEFIESMVSFNFNIDDKTQNAIEEGLYQVIPSAEVLKEKFKKDRDYCHIMIGGSFLMEMKRKNFSFVLSGHIWNKMLVYWTGNNKKKNAAPDVFFSVNTNLFDKHLSQLSNIAFLDNTSEKLAALWGSVYVYDFLLSIGLISQSTYDNFIKTTRILKGKAIGQDSKDLWKSAFVQQWEKPDGISEAEFNAEKKIFEKSYLFTSFRFSDFEKEIEDELAAIGELADYIIEGGKTDKFKTNSLLKKLMEAGLGSKADSDEWPHYPLEKIEPVRNENKVGRNDPCPCGSGTKYKKCCGK
jgi:hypothetical protein